MSASEHVVKAVIPVAGMGTRFLPATKSTPKEMFPVVDKPAIEYVVEEAADAGISNLLMITGRNKRALEDHFDRNYELESVLADRGTPRSLLPYSPPPNSPPSTTCDRATPRAWGMPCCARLTTWAATRSRCCSAMT